jgi:dipeptidyl aminopeptidase/acylaminoacyl peptidase
MDASCPSSIFSPERTDSVRKLFCLSLATVLLSLASPAGRAQGTLDDYKRADKLRDLFQGKVFKEQLDPHWIGDTPFFWYRTDVRGNREFILVDAEKASRAPAFDHGRLAQALSKAAGQQFAATKLPFEEIAFVEDGKALEFDAAGKRWRCALDSYEVKEQGKAEEKKPDETNRPGNRRRRVNDGERPEEGGPQKPDPTKESRPVASPDGKWEAFTRNYNLFLRSVATREEYPLTGDGTDKHLYSPRILWAPDSKKLVTDVVKPVEERLVHYVASSPEDQLQPKYSTNNYAKPGDAITVRKPRLFQVATKSDVAVDDALFDNPFDLGDYRWQADSSAFYFYYNQRGHQVARVIALDAETGKTRAAIEEKSDTFIDYAGKKVLFFSDKSDDLIWASERDGWNHLYLYDRKSGQVKNQITKGEWVVRGIEKIDDEKRQIWFRASGLDPDQDPYFVHYCRVNFDGSGFVRLTSGNGTHSIRYSPKETWFVDTWSRVDQPPVHELRRAQDGSLVMELERADASDLLAAGWRAPEPFKARSRDDRFDIWGVLYRPLKLDESKKYPIIEDIYAGPQDSFVPKGWRDSYRQQALAELGFIVVQIDGMGTSNRARDFHHFAAKNIADAGLPDRIKWIRAAAERYPYLDTTRVGVFGTSAGGQSALGALLFYPDFYKAAVASCGCHDNRMDKIWWNELWMGWPVGPHYAEQSNVTNAAKLRGKLLLIVGESDHNVDPASTLQVVNALIKAKKEFELLVVPGMDHSDGGPYGERRRRDFFVRNLLKVEPPDWNNVSL